MSKFPTNDIKFNAVRSLNLPASEYAITQSGVLGIREVREIGGIDMVVTDQLWATLAEKYPIVTENGITKIKIEPYIELMHEGSFGPQPVAGRPTIKEQLTDSENIDGLSFVSLDNVLFFKQLDNRPKDQPDISEIQRLIAKRP